MEYVCELDQLGNRRDQEQRVELSCGCVEFLAPTEYMVRPPMPPTYFFVLDVSNYSIASGMLKTAVETIRGVLDDFSNERTNIGFLTFDSSVHFYNLKGTLSQPRMVVVSDIDDIFLPLPEDMLVNLKESREVVNSLLAKLPTMHQNTTFVDIALGPALEAAWNVMSGVGGKMMVFISKLPTVGFAPLKMRQDPKILGTDKEVNLLRPASSFYEEFALKSSRQQISVDTFLFSPRYTDVATISTLSRFTGGQTFYYPAFEAHKDAQKFSQDLMNVLTRETAWEGVMRVRVSKGLKTTNHYGNFNVRSSDLLSLATTDSDKTFAVQLQVTENISTLKYASIQSALLYTNSHGERRIRVCTVCLPITSSLSNVFKYADQHALVTITSKMAVEKVMKFKLSDARQALLNKCIDILKVYRANFASPSTSTKQLLLPQSLKLLPLYTLAIIKNTAFRSGADVLPDQRAYCLSLLRILSVERAIPFIYPSLYALHNMPPECGTIGKDGSFTMPPVGNLSKEKLDRAGMYLLADGQKLLLWVSSQCNPSFVQQIFGVPVLDDNHLRLVEQDNEMSRRVMAIVGYIRQYYPGFQQLYVIREGDPMQEEFFSHFIEDRSRNLLSYYEFLDNYNNKFKTSLPDLSIPYLFPSS
eukprot:CAMPEP_0174270286 /NCGR_PEP_ID=MMETSP0439-20130205/43913_1 /TAXON_ID=0 /ORGANISM="Stereomyxa ramosa, Strain Chinc5" /LENGTH=642 /DNA_ID=CAMNT_0015359519 /DNA_START=782 /DNA_END=2707 /DNA_ORIENTATION=-